MAYMIECRRNSNAADWKRYLGPWSYDEAVQFVSYWNGQFGYPKYRLIEVH